MAWLPPRYPHPHEMYPLTDGMASMLYYPCTKSDVSGMGGWRSLHAVLFVLHVGCIC